MGLMKTEIRHPRKKAHTGSYSPAILVDGWVYVSGQGPLDMATGAIVPGTVEEEVHLTMTHIGTLLAEAGCTFDDVVKCTVHLADINDFGRFDKVYATFFPGIRPARTTVQSVLWGGIKVEIDCVARLPE
jgi:2-iminobutanoate/2-iminopropanoate deaminase